MVGIIYDQRVLGPVIGRTHLHRPDYPHRLLWEETKVPRVARFWLSAVGAYHALYHSAVLEGSRS